MRSALLVCDRAALLKHLRQRFAINWHGAHGASHWARVRNNGLMIAEATGANMAVVEIFAFFHDSCRIGADEYFDHTRGGIMRRTHFIVADRGWSGARVTCLRAVSALLAGLLTCASMSQSPSTGSRQA